MTPQHHPSIALPVPPYSVMVGEFTESGTSGPAMARPGSKAVVLSVSGAGPVGASLRIFGSADAVQWEEFDLMSVEGHDLASGWRAIYTDHPFLRVAMDWVRPGTVASVAIRSPASDRTITRARMGK